MKFLPGDEIKYTVSYLKMDSAPNFSVKKKTIPNRLLLKAKNPPTNYFLNLYLRIGAAYEWTDRLLCPVDETESFLSNDRVELYTYLTDGWIAGFFVLDRRESDICDLAYFGLVPEAIGLGHGKYLLKAALKMCWDGLETKKVTVNTNSLDHPNALPLYLKMGFKLVRKEVEKRTLTQSRIVIDK